MNKDKYQWDLEALLKNESFDNLYSKWKNAFDETIHMYEHIFDSAENFKKWLANNNELEMLSNRINNYAYNHANIDVTNPKWIGLLQKLRNDSNELMVKISDYENRVLNNMDKIKEYIKDPELKEYERFFDMYFRMKPHILSEVEEKLMSELSRADGAIDEIYSTIINSDIKYEDATDNHGTAHPISTMSDAFVMMKSRDATLRMNTWINFNKAFYTFRNSLTQSLYYNFLEFNTHSKVRKHKDYVNACCFNDEVDEKLIPHIYSQVEQYKNIYEKYSIHRDRLLKNMLNIKTVEVWDRMVDLCEKDVTFTIDQAQTLVLEALKPMGPQYLKIVQKAFDEQWISWLPQENKLTGAYSIGGTKGLDKFYILMNYDKTLNSVSTLIHELGHSLNSYFFKDQKVYCSTSIFTAEVASITNEMLLNYYLLDKYKNDNEMRIVVLDELISGFFATTSRQIIFSNFEYIINQKINENKPVTYEVIEDVYMNLINKYIYVENIQKYNSIPYKYNLATPLRISHFYAGNFYVYKYSIGQVVAIIIANRIINKHPQATEKYMEFLKSGTSRSPIDTIKLLDIDLYNEKPWQEAHEIMNTFIDEFCSIKTLNKNKN